MNVIRKQYQSLESELYAKQAEFDQFQLENDRLSDEIKDLRRKASEAEEQADIKLNFADEMRQKDLLDGKMRIADLE